ncbi:protein tyrosine phosphatase [Ophiobolus disseminans]|uniref:Very-long-chain (3R)-3-hydroxyacyl-CoA dehydratase n=1 Tax=Ophiobolus disseminans TaxID=1469910 RepID=A0A6A6ZXQ7_9PLEO|nr:protein tyrosine phosphatase [Ophiobolus disseminans]
MAPKSSSTSRSSKPTSPSSSAKKTYLLAYNALSAALWAGVLSQTVSIGSHEVTNAGKNGWFTSGEGPLGAVQKGLGSGNVYDSLEGYTRMVQTLAGLEVLHSIFGIVRAPLLTTLMQVTSRFLLVWGIAHPFPQTTRYSPAYATMLLAWSFTEVVRYSYFVFNLSGVGVPKLWTWLRYNTFLVLYPMGVASECWLVWNASGPAGQMNDMFRYALWAILGIYVPGFYVLFTHMLTQRRKLQREARRTL